MTFDKNSITDISVEGDKETPGIGTLALEQLPDTILKAQSAEIDGIASATITSDAILMAAAASAGQNGASVIVLEANGIVGGSTIRSGGHMLVFDNKINASMERNDKALESYLEYDPGEFGEWKDTLLTLQEQIKSYLSGNDAGRFDSVEMALIDHYIKGRGKDIDGNDVTIDFELCRNAFENAAAINSWLGEGGMKIQDKMYNAHGGTPVDGASAMVNALQTMAEASGAKIILNMRATDLIVENGSVTGVTAVDSNGTKHTYHAQKGVILATGSFSSNGAMCAQYQRMETGLTANVGSTNPATNTGDGIIMAENAGAALRDMGLLFTLMKGYHEGCSTGEFGKINGTQQLIVNAEGKRFMDDVKAGGMTTTGVLNSQPDGLAYFVGDSSMIHALNESVEGFVDDMCSRGDWFVVADSLEEALAKSGLDVETAMETITTFNGYVDAGTDPDFGRTAFNGKVENGPFAAVKMENHYHLTFGGLVIDTDAQVLDENNQPIPHLYAAGDVISGFEGAAHQSGDCLTVVLFYGKVAGQKAALRQGGHPG